MSVLVTRPAPPFKSHAVMPDCTFGQIALEDYQEKKYVLLFFYPLNFTFVCPTEIIAFSDRESEFAALDVQILGVSIDSKFSHLVWRKMPRTEGGLGEIAYPLIADLNKSISRTYDVLFDESVSLRALFLIDKGGIVRHQLVNDLPLGQSVDEALRMVQALQLFEKSGEVCPADWHAGARAIKPTITESKKFFSAQYAEKT